jgi:predicted phosphate transport protein (TIGR00153 family)
MREKSRPVLVRLFGKSPITPLQKHMEVSRQAAAALLPFMHAVIAEDWPEAETHADLIYAREADADELKRSIRVGMPRSIFSPFSRSDLLELLDVQDKIPNAAQDIAGLMLGRKATVPPAVAQSLIEFLETSVQATQLAAEALDKLDDLIETGFLGREVTEVESLVVGLGEIEHKTDLIQRQVRAELFAVERDLHAIDVMFLYRVIDWIGQLADEAERVGNRLLYLISK